MFFDSLTMPERTVERQARALAPVLGATNDGRAHAENARGLMITVLGEFVRPSGGSAWTQTLIDAMVLLGVQPKTTRQVLSRLADRGWLDRSKDGRRTRWHLTAISRSLLESGADRIYGFGHGATEWDGQWLVLLASLPDRDQSLRYRLTTGLNWAGFGSLGQGTWISPWMSREAAAVDVIREVGVEGATTFVAQVGQLGAGVELAARAWDLDAVRSHYDDFLAETGRTTGTETDAATTDRSTSDEDAVAQLAMTVHRWRRFPFLDPGLPDALLPDDWPGQRAVQTFSARRATLGPLAERWWHDTEHRYGPTAA